VDSGTELGLSGYLGLRQHHRPTLGNARHAEGRHKTLPPTGRVFSVGKPTALRVQNISGPRASVSTAPSSNVYGRHPIPSEAAPAFCGLGAGRHGYSASPSCPRAARANNEGGQYEADQPPRSTGINRRHVGGQRSRSGPVSDSATQHRLHRR